MSVLFRMSVLFSWIWVLSGLLSLYFLAIAAFSDGAWSHFFLVFAVSVIAKGITRNFMHGDKRKRFESQLISEGYTPEEARREYARQLSTGEWSLERVERIIQDYGGALERKSPGPNGMVADEDQLPHPKKVIQMAILFMLERGELTAEQKDSLMTGFISLADFQSGVDEGDAGTDLGGDEFLGLPTEEKIQIIANQGVGEDWLEASNAEREKLVQQLKRDGHWQENGAISHGSKTELSSSDNDPSLADDARKKAIELSANIRDAKSAAEKASLHAIYAFEDELTKKNGRRTRASRTWKMVNRHGILEAVERAVNRDEESAGSTALAHAGQQEFTFEAVVLRFPEHFSKETVEKARKRMEDWTNGQL